MDLDNLNQNMNTRVVFKEPRGMIRWLQLFFALIAFSTVVDFSTNLGISITCPTQPAPTSSTTAAPPAVNGTAPVAPAIQPAALQQAQTSIQAKLVIAYPFDFTNADITNNCTGYNQSYVHVSPLSGSPQFFVMTGVLAFIYSILSLVVYLFFSSTYESIPIWPVADLIATGILCLFWFIASISFSSGVSLLKSTVVYQGVQQQLCPKPQFDGLCVETEQPSWKSLNVGIVSGFLSFFLWGSGMWFVYKETHFHVPRN